MAFINYLSSGEGSQTEVWKREVRLWGLRLKQRCRFFIFIFNLQGFWNPPLALRKNYNIYLQAVSSTEKVTIYLSTELTVEASKKMCMDTVITRSCAAGHVHACVLLLMDPLVCVSDVIFRKQRLSVWGWRLKVRTRRRCSTSRVRWDIKCLLEKNVLMLRVCVRPFIPRV